MVDLKIADLPYIVRYIILMANLTNFLMRRYSGQPFGQRSMAGVAFLDSVLTSFPAQRRRLTSLVCAVDLAEKVSYTS
jgi:hypothetical protein